MPSQPCRLCGDTRLETFLDLGSTPLADALLTDEMLLQPEPRFPLEVAFCPSCSLVQILEEVPPEQLFVDNYLYFSSYSDALVGHARDHARSLVEGRGLDSDSLVVEIASNDGYLLRHFASAGVPVLGIDPAPDQALAAEAAGVPTITEFFGTDLAERLRTEGRVADVIIANNVMAHVPDLNGFVAGMRTLLADDGVITVENPYVRDLIDKVEFDTIYHEHHCYFSCTAVEALMRRNGLHLNHVEYFPWLHGGTLRWHSSHRPGRSAELERYLADEREKGIAERSYYARFGARVTHVRDALRALLAEIKHGGGRVAAYGAAAKGATLLNYVGLDTDAIDFVVDRNPHKQGKYMPGARIPILAPEALLERRPDAVLLLAWNFADEIATQQREYLDRGGRFIVPVPEPKLLLPEGAPA